MAYLQKSPIPVVEGGTGSQSLTGVLTGNATSAITANAVTQYDVIVGGASNAVGSVGPGSAGQVFQSGGNAANPAYSTATYPASTTINELLYSSANNVVDQVTAGNYGVLISSSAGVPSWLTNGTTGEILTATTSGTPSWESPAASSISITGNTGGALTGNAFTITGGATGLTFAGAGSTETLGGTLAIANGGTDATSFTQSNGVVTYNGTRLVNYAGPQISSAGVATNTAQPAFMVYLSTTANNVTGNGTVYQVAFDTVVYDQASNYNTGTYIFTAPVTGIYNFGYCIYFDGQTAANTLGLVRFAATSGAWETAYSNFGTETAANGLYIISASTDMKMTATDTVYLTVYVNGGTQTVNVVSSGTPESSRFYGRLIC